MPIDKEKVPIYHKTTLTSVRPLNTLTLVSTGSAACSVPPIVRLFFMSAARSWSSERNLNNS